MLLREAPPDYSVGCSSATITNGSARSSYSTDRPDEPRLLNGLTTIEDRYSSGTFDLICSCMRSAEELRNWVPRPSSGIGSSSLPTWSPLLIVSSPYSNDAPEVALFVLSLLPTCTIPMLGSR